MSNMKDFLRYEHMPHIWCPGCGNGIVMGNVIRAIQEAGFDRDKTVIVSGIGCSSRAPGYMDFDTLHTAHGRALPFATGIKAANPDLNVIVISGDGDASAIGGNHLIHACRRNIDLTLVIVNNSIYGMTSGQYSPLTPTGAFATTAVYGNIDKPFDLVRLCEGAGASYVARASVYHAMQLKNYLKNGMLHKGFSVIEAVSTCPTYFGRKNGVKTAVDMMNWIKDNSEPVRPGVREYEKLYPIGEFVNRDEPEYLEKYHQVIEKAEGKK